MPPTRREVLAQLAALVALPLPAWTSPHVAADPLAGTIRDYQAGRARGEWSAADVTALALERCRTLGGSGTRSTRSPTRRSAEARAADERARAGRLRGPLDGVPVFAKSIYDMQGLPTTASSAEWARLFPEAVGARCTRGRANARGGRDRARQDGGRRLRLSRQWHQQLHGAGPQPVRSHRDSYARGFERRHRRWPWRAGWRSRRSAPTTVAPIASRRSSPGWSG